MNAQRASDSGALQCDNEFWHFSLAVYGQAGVAEECLALQDIADIDVNVLLFCAWTGARAIVLSRADIERAIRRVAAWHNGIVRPLREVRQSLKGLEYSESEDFRTRVKGIELEAEQIEQAILFACSRHLQSTGSDIRSTVAGNVGRYIEMTAGPKGSTAPRLIDAAMLHLRS